MSDRTRAALLIIGLIGGTFTVAYGVAWVLRAFGLEYGG